ncbi:ELWxxDGT repeat protein, partial [Pyxidicoccus sp. 3LG]
MDYQVSTPPGRARDIQVSRTYEEGTRWALRGLWLCMALVLGCAETSPEPARPSAGQAASRTRALASGPPFFVSDVWQGEAPVYNQLHAFATAGDLLYFASNTPGAGTELWRTNGTTEGTFLVKDLLPGPSGSEPSGLTELGGWLYFSARSSAGMWGRPEFTLWRTRGTPEQTEFVLPLGNDPHFITRMGDSLYFIARGGDESPWASSLWRSDGTAAGNRPLMTLATYGGHNANSTAQLDGTLFFTGADAAHGLEVWKTDGTPEGTVLVEDIAPGRNDAWPMEYVAVNGVVLFWARTGDWSSPARLWRTDGTPEGTFPIQNFSVYSHGEGGPTSLTVVGDVAYFSAWDARYGQELWRTDGTASGTYPLDLLPGAAGSTPVELTAFAGQLYFEAWDADDECMMWRSDGTVEGTTRFIDINRYPGCTLEWRAGMFATPDALYFFASETGDWGSHELWRSDGTAAGTVRLTDTLAVKGVFDALHSWRNGTLYFTARDGELWTSDGTAEGTRVLLRKSGTGPSSRPREAASLKGTLFFVANDGATGEELWMSDGTPEGTTLVADLTPGPDYTSPFSLTPLGGQLFFLTGRSGDSWNGLWRTDGSRSGTRLIATVWGGATKPMAVLGEALYFVRRLGSFEQELWKTDGTVEGTSRVMGVTGLPSGWQPEHLTRVGGRLYFVAYADSNRQALWVSDGTPAGTRRLKDLAPPGGFATVHRLVEVDGTLFFFASVTGLWESLWKSDGTEESTVPVGPVAGYDEWREFSTANLNGTLYYLTNEEPYVLWKSDGAALERVREFPSNRVMSPPGALTAFKGALYFWAFDTEHGYELWRSDGTEAGTAMLRELAPGQSSSVANPSSFLALGPDGPLVFSASDGLSGMELWQTDGTAEGTVRVADLAPGQDSSSPWMLASSGRHLFFSAWQRDTGIELWALPRTVTDTTPPELVCPGAGFVEATSWRGAPAVYASATATDETDPHPGLFYSIAPGEPLPMGRSSVTVTAADETGNRSTCRFDLTVRDTQPPTLVCPPAQSAEATSLQGAWLWFPSPQARDAASVPVVRTSVWNGDWFRVGTTEVEVTATDGVGLVATCHFPIQVVDTLPPRVECPAPMRVEATQSGGASVPFGLPSASDLASLPTVRSSPEPGSTFPLGTTPVTVTARDGSGNEGQCMFSVEVVDTTPPRLTCPARQQVEATSAQGVLADYPDVEASDPVSQARVEFAPANGSLLPLGTTQVTVTATDDSGNPARCTFEVEVLPQRRDAPPPLPPPPG